MPIEFSCTQCGRQLQAGNATSGTRILCPGCGAFSAVPAREAPAAIEFRCTGCNKLLRTGGETAGKQAKCPDCGAIVPVPGQGPGVPDETLPHPGPAGPPSEETGSPFAAAGGAGAEAEPPGPSAQPPGVETGSPFKSAAAEPAAVGDPENPYLAPTQYGQPATQQWAGADPMAATRVAGPATALIVYGSLGLAAQLLGLVANLVQVGGGMAGPGQADMPIFLSGGVAVGSAIIGAVLHVVVIVGGVKMKNLESYAFAMAASIIAMLPCSCCCPIGLPLGIWSLVVLSDAGVKAAFRG